MLPVAYCRNISLEEGEGMSFVRSPRALVAISLAAVVIVFAAYSILGSPGPVGGGVPSRFTVNGKTFAFTYVATDQASRQAGLMNRKVTNTTTMLFVFPSPGTYTFWMYDTNTSLDMIWVDATGSSGRIVYVVTGAQPCYNQLSCPTYVSTAQANYVIEAKAGFVEANGVVVGDLVQFG